MSRILIAEDEAHILRVMSLWLKRHGHDILEAPDGAAALELLDREGADLLISDMNMPRVDGFELVRAVRESRELAIPIMLLSARCDHDRLSRRMRPFHVLLFPKPFVPSRLVAEIDRLLAVHSAGDLPS
ncbi:MAG: response regulator [Phycisphaerae bacterium]